MENVYGYFTIENNIKGLTLQEMETSLGFRPGRLTSGARILLLKRQPSVGEFVFAGSTRYSNAKGLVGVQHRLRAASKTLPHAWLGQRLVKVAPNLRHTERETYPHSTSPVEQWELLEGIGIPADEICRLNWHQAYWPRR